MAQTVVAERSMLQKIGLPLAFAALFIIIFLPQPEGLPVAGQRMLGLLVFSVILWLTEAVTYPVSAGAILAMMTLLLGFSPSVANPEVNYTMGAALGMGLRGFSTGAWALVSAALFLACAMQMTGYDRRLALKIMSFVGAKSSRILLGTIFVGFVLAFFVPSTTARVACIVPIIMGIITTFKIDRRGPFAALLMITCASIASVWNMGIKTAAAQNMVATGFIRNLLGHDISWLEWFVAAAPFAAVFSVALFFILPKILKPEIDEVPGGDAAIKEELRKLGPMSGAEKRLMLVSIALLLFWVFEGKTWGMFGVGGALGGTKIHPFDTSSITVILVAMLMFPYFGVMTWKQASERLDWGTVFLFAVGISLGSAIMSTQAGPWLAKAIVPAFGLATSTPFIVLIILSLFLIIIHLGFASATALASALIPIIIAVLSEVAKTQPVNVVGMTMILQFVVSFGFILPANAPQNMIAYGTDTFTPRQFIRAGIPATVAGFVLLLIFAATYWKWMGLL